MCMHAEDGCNEIPSTETQTRTPAKTPKMWEDLEEHHLENLIHV